MEDLFVVHGTNVENLMSILDDGHIDNDPPKRMMAYQNDPKQIFTQLIWKGIIGQAKVLPFWGNACIVLDAKVLKDFPLYVLPGNSGAMDHSFQKNMKWDSKYILARAHGKLDKIPDLCKVKKIHSYETERRP